MPSADRTPCFGCCNWRAAIVWVAALLGIAAPARSDPREPPAAYRLGIFPYLSPRSIVEQWGPVSAAMSTALGVPVKLETAASFSGFTRGLSARSYDIALIQPFDYADAVDRRGYVPLARLSVPLVAEFFVRSDSGYQSLSDLRGTTVALPPAPSAITRIALHVLQDRHLVPGRDINVRYFNAHDSCIQQVWIGSASACATTQPLIASFEQRMHARLRSIHSAPPIPHVLFVAHPSVPVARRELLRQLILGWSRNDEGRALLKKLNMPGFVPVQAGEYAVMRRYTAPRPVLPAAERKDHNLFLGDVVEPVSADADRPAGAIVPGAGDSDRLRCATAYDQQLRWFSRQRRRWSL